MQYLRLALIAALVGICGCGSGGGSSAPAPISWWKADGNTVDATGGNNATIYNGVSYAQGVTGQAFSFDGVNGAISVPDADNLKITGSFTIDVWVKVTSYPPSTQDHGIIVFRGDERVGLDPYVLTVDRDTLLHFTMNAANNGAVDLSAAIPLNQFVHVTGTLDAATGDMRLYENSQVVAQTTTAIRPFHDLDPTAHPGIGIGNHSGYPNTFYNYPFHGLIDELKIYNTVVPP